MTLRKYMPLVIMVVLCFAQQGAASDVGQHMVYIWTYYPDLRATTYVPVTINNIEQQQCQFHLEYSDKKLKELLDSLAQESSGSFDGFNVRVKIGDMPSGNSYVDVYVDSEGGFLIIGDASKVSHMTEAAFSDFASRLMELASKMGCTDDGEPVAVFRDGELILLDRKDGSD